MDDNKVSVFWAVAIAMITVSLFMFLSISIWQIQKTRREFAKQGLQYKTIEVPTYAYGNWVK